MPVRVAFHQKAIICTSICSLRWYPFPSSHITICYSYRHIPTDVQNKVSNTILHHFVKFAVWLPQNTMNIMKMYLENRHYIFPNTTYHDPSVHRPVSFCSAWTRVCASSSSCVAGCCPFGLRQVAAPSPRVRKTRKPDRQQMCCSGLKMKEQVSGINKIIHLLYTLW